MKSTREKVVRHPSLATRATLGLEAVHQVDDVEEAAAGAIPDAGAGDRDGEVGLAGPGAADQDDATLVGQELAGREVAHERFVDGRAREGELVDILGERQLGDGDLVLDRAGLLLGDLGLE